MDDAFIRQNLVRENMMQAMKSGNMAEEYRQASFFSNGYDYGYDYGYGYGYGHGRGHGLAGAGDFGFRGLNIQDRDFRKSLAGIGMNTGMSMNMGMGLVQGPGMDIALNIGGMNGVNMGMITAEEKMKSITGEL